MTKPGVEVVLPRMCQAEDQGGWPCGAAPVVYRLTPEELAKNNGKQRYYCKDHKTNKFVWDESEVELIPDDDVAVGEMVWCTCEDGKLARLRGHIGKLVDLNEHCATVEYSAFKDRVTIQRQYVRRHK